MNDYDFSTLNDKEFENLTIDLISRDRNKRFERFKSGRDGGIDGRYYGEDGKQEIIQCKHYLKTGYNGLISSLKKKNRGKNEADKVKLLDPKKYIFVTSLPLSASNKKEIREIFNPYIKSDSDIYGQEDLNDLLRANPDIEENHYKLWISSTTVLKRIFNNAIKGRSEFLLEEIQDKIKYYVVTENHNKAIEKLESSHTIIIAGEPGIGKTTLAEQIALWYIEKGFEFCVIARDISEAEAIFERGKKQIFYFDDFLGSNYLNALEAHTDSHIMQFITRIKRDKNKRFILTSRTNIFNQGLSLSDKFRTKKLDSDEFIITVDELTEIDKAKILYNHLWHGNLRKKYIDELYKKDRYKKIINHQNFNPRLIEFITDIDRIRSISVRNYWQNIQEVLNNPTEIWANTFNKQSDEFIRNIVSLVVFNGNSIDEERLKKAYYRFNRLIKLENNSHISKEFDSVIEETVKYFLNRSREGDTIIYSLFNPSIADFVINTYRNDEEKLFSFLDSLQTIDALKNFSFIFKNKLKKIIQKFYYKIDINNLDNIDFTIKIISLIDFDSQQINLNDKIIPFCEEIINESKKFSLNKEFLNILIDIWESGEEFEIYEYNFIIKIINRASFDIDEINLILLVIYYFDMEDYIAVDISMNNLISEYLKERLQSELKYIDIYDIEFYNIDENDFDEVYDIESIIKSKLEDFILEIDYFNFNLNIDKTNILSSIDISIIEEKIVDMYMGYIPQVSDTDLDINDIDDLFQRD